MRKKKSEETEERGEKRWGEIKGGETEGKGENSLSPLRSPVSRSRLENTLIPVPLHSETKGLGQTVWGKGDKKDLGTPQRARVRFRNP